MAKGQKRSTREPRKPKLAKSKPAASQTAFSGSLGRALGAAPPAAATSKAPRPRP